MNLYLFPEAATHKDGYGIAVDYAYRKLKPSRDDLVVWLSNYPKEEMNYLKDTDIIIRRKDYKSLRSAKMFIKGKSFSEVTEKELYFLKGMDFEEIHCDEVIFYRAVRLLFPHKRLTVRFHNSFARINVRNQFLKRDIGLKYWLNLCTFTKLERDIFNDRNVYKIFLTDEDRDFYRSIYGIKSDSETWPCELDRDRIKDLRNSIILTNKLVWYGGIVAHKVSSVNWFVKQIMPELRKARPDFELHLWGDNTLQFDNPQQNIFGHGFYEGDGIPLDNALYVNPDIIGGGIKLKLVDLLENGVPFISTPFGFEGYSTELIDRKYCNVEEEDRWVDRILEIFDTYGVK